MATIDVEILDGDFEPTTDYVMGRPTVHVNVQIGGQEVLSGQFALLDTGSNRTMVRPEVVIGLTPKGATHFDGVQGKSDVPIFDAVLEMCDFRESFPLEIGVANNIPYPVLLGRDILQHYRMVFDPKRGVFNLSNDK